MLDHYQEEIIQKNNLTKIKKAFRLSLLAFLIETIGFLGYKISPSFLPLYEFAFYARPIYQLIMLISAATALVSIGILRKYQKSASIFYIGLGVAIIVFVTSTYNLLSSILFAASRFKG